MKSYIAGLFAVLAVCGVASARTVDIADWDFTAPDGSSLTNALDSINGYYYPDHGGISISNNAVHFESFSNAVYSVVPIEPIENGKVKMSWDVLPSTLSNGQVAFGLKGGVSNEVSLANLRFDSNNTQLRFAAYVMKADGSENEWVYVGWLQGGGDHDLTGTIHISMEYDIATGHIDWLWSGAKSGSKSYDGYASPVGGLGMQGTMDKMGTSDFVELDNLHVSHILAPNGALVQDMEAAALDTNSVSHSFGPFDATNGDYVVVVASSNEGNNPNESSVSFTGAVGQVTYQVVAGNGPGTFAWYAPVTNAGPVDIAYAPAEALTGNTKHIVGAYLVRSTSGLLHDPVFVSDTAGGGPTASTLAYTLSSQTDGIFIEAHSAYSGASPNNGDTLVDENQWMQRIVAHGIFWGLTELTNTWTIGTSAHSTLGIAFTGVQTETPELLLYNEWTANYPDLGADTAMTNNPDGDLLDNLAEYAFGGDPSDGADLGHVVQRSFVDEGGTLYMEYIYAKRSDAGDRGLAYSLETNGDLIFGSWTNADYTVTGIGAGAFGPGFDAVTNRVPATDAKKFIRTQVGFSD